MVLGLAPIKLKVPSHTCKDMHFFSRCSMLSALFVLADFVGTTLKVKFGLSHSTRAPLLLILIFKSFFSSVSCAFNFISRKYPQASVGCLCPACARNNSSPVVSCSIWGCSRGLYSCSLLPFPICFSPPWFICPLHHSQHGSTTWSSWRREFSRAGKPG